MHSLCPFLLYSLQEAHGVNYLFHYSLAPTGHRWYETHDLKANKGQALKQSRPWWRAYRFTFKKMKYIVIKPLSAEADKFISGATFTQQPCIYLPCPHAGCANCTHWGESEGNYDCKNNSLLIGSVIWIRWLLWGKHCLHGEGFVWLWSLWCCAQMFPSASQDVIHNYTSSGRTPEPSGVSRGAD